MNINDGSRFNLNLFLKPEITKNKSNINFQNLVQKSQEAIQSVMNDTEIQDLYRNKSVALMFFDRVGEMLGPLDPYAAEAENFMYGPTFFASTEMMRYCSELMLDPTLDDISKQILADWIESEKELLPYSLIIGGWRMKNEALMNFVHQESKRAISDLRIPELVLPPTEEVRVLTQAMTDRVKAMKVGQKCKLPSGCLSHETRVTLVKNADSTFDVFHYNTGLGALEFTGYKYSSVPASVIENQEFWMKFIEAKINPDMAKLLDLFDSFGRPHESLGKLMNKPLQLNNSCTFHAVEADFKHSFISKFDSIEKGWEEYKKCTSLMALIAKNQEAPHIMPRLATMLDDREKIRHRYLDWLTIVNNKEEFEKLKNAYIDAIFLVVKPQMSKEAIGKIYANEKSHLLDLASLDKVLSQSLEDCTYENFVKVKAIGEACPVNGVNYMGMDKMMQMKYLREQLEEFVVTSNEDRNLVNKLRKVSTGSLKLDRKVRQVFPFMLLERLDFQPSLFTRRLLRCFKTEEPEVMINLISKMMENNLVDREGIQSICIILRGSRPELSESLSKFLHFLR